MNEMMQRCREMALEVLKPTQAQIDHGLELHKASIVVDSYGFAPRAAMDGEAFKAAVEAGASDAELSDLSEEMSMTRYVTAPAERQEYMAAWEASGVTCIFQNAGQEGQAVGRIIKRLARFTYVTDMMRDFVAKAATPDDIVAAKEQGRHCLYFTCNGVPLPQHWDYVEEELGYVRIFFQLGSRMMHLTYNRRNMIGDGCAEPANAGLSDFGRAAIREMNRVGVIVDCAHSGWQTSLEAAQVSERPMVASHSACAAVNEHHRCKPDEVIRAIADTGGYIGICAVPAFLGGKGDIGSLLDHIDHVVKGFGAEHVAIGTDVAYTSANFERERAKVPARRKLRDPFRSFWQPNDPVFAEEWHKERMVLSLAWTNWPFFTIGMVQRGYSDEDIRKILGGNVMRVARAVLPS